MATAQRGLQANLGKKIFNNKPRREIGPLGNTGIEE